ncbi:MAG TPA: transporter substrate-binding domain-containing protein [Pyrinomonadaceae bacterium]|jgi:ABC-type amino acid transport substrate-binding protein
MRLATVKNRALCSLLVVALVAVSAFSGCNRGAAGPSGQETVYERVIKAGKIRAAYISYPPACMKDTKTGKLTGIFVETLEKAAENVGLKVEWTEEVGWGSQIEGLQADRYDIIGSPVWANPTRGKMTGLSIPVYYSGIGIYVRQDDNRFSNNYTAINSSNVRIATIDGETGDLIARTQFPLAQRDSLPQTTDISQLFLELTGNKADVMFAEPYFAHQFLQGHPNSVKNIAAENPIRTLGNVYMFKRDQAEFKQMLDVAVEDLINSGFVDQLISKYEPAPNTFYRVAQPYRLIEQTGSKSATASVR